MFFIVSKTVAFLLVPSNLLLICGVAGVALWLTRWRRLGLRLAAFGLLSLLVLAIVPIGSALVSVLESRFPPWSPAKGAPDGIVVLGGAISPSRSSAAGIPTVNGDAGRLLAMAKLARDYPQARIVYSGGDATLFGNGVAETNLIHPLLDSLGVPRARVMLETKARNTVENAIYTKNMVQPKPGERWLLVTSAYHMPRAVGCFRQVGFVVEAYPSNWRALPPWQWDGSRLLSSIGMFDFAVREWIGLVAYRLTGKTDALLPAP